MHTREIALAAVPLAASASFLGCTSKLDYDSHPVQHALQEVSGKRVLRSVQTRTCIRRGSDVG
jgi:hypothetical protein